MKRPGVAAARSAIAAIAMIALCGPAEAQGGVQQPPSRKGLNVYVNLRSFGNDSILLFAL